MDWRVEVNEHIAGGLEKPVELHTSGQSVGSGRVVLDGRAVELRAAVLSAAVEEVAHSFGVERGSGPFGHDRVQRGHVVTLRIDATDEDVTPCAALEHVRSDSADQQIIAVSSDSVPDTTALLLNDAYALDFNTLMITLDTRMT